MIAGRIDPARVVEVRGDLAEAEWGPEEDAGQGIVQTFRATSTKGVRTRGLIKWQPAAGGSRTIDRLYLMLAGQGTGARAARLLHLPPGHAVAALDYPYEGSRDLGRAVTAFASLPALDRAARVTPASLSLAGLAMAKHRALAGAQVTLVGASFGGPFTILAAAAERDRYTGTALLYTFARLDLLLAKVVGSAPWPRSARALAHRVLSGLASPYEPEHHLPRLAGMPLYILNDMDDPLIPRASIEALHAAAPSGAHIERVTGGHVRPDAPELIADLVARVIAWSRRSI